MPIFCLCRSPGVIGIFGNEARDNKRTGILFPGSVANFDGGFWRLRSSLQAGAIQVFAERKANPNAPLHDASERFDVHPVYRGFCFEGRCSSDHIDIDVFLVGKVDAYDAKRQFGERFLAVIDECHLAEKARLVENAADDKLLDDLSRELGIANANPVHKRGIRPRCKAKDDIDIEGWNILSLQFAGANDSNGARPHLGNFTRWPQSGNLVHWGIPIERI